MGWANFAIEKLQRGESVRIKPRGHSMRGKVEDGQEVLLRPVSEEELSVGDIVLVRLKGTVLLHLIKAVAPHRVLIGNNRGKINGWASKRAVYGLAIEVAGKSIVRKS